MERRKTGKIVAPRANLAKLEMILAVRSIFALNSIYLAFDIGSCAIPGQNDIKLFGMEMFILSMIASYDFQ